MVGPVGADGRLALPWLEPLLRAAVGSRRPAALLLHGPENVGQFELAVALAQADLCEADASAVRPCGRCADCRLVQAGSHPDLRVVLPEALAETLGWAEAEADAGAERSSKAKPSREIKVDAIRSAVGFARTTSARGRGKRVVIHPAERMNGIAANTLLKTLEEPPGDTGFLLVTSAPDALLPTVRSRCLGLALGLPPEDQALAWLAGQGVEAAPALLAATGGRPAAALELAREGVDAAAWAALPRAVASGQVALLAAWPLPRAIDALSKLAHDLACVAAGAAPRYFPAGALPAADGPAVQHWNAVLLRAARHADHPWNPGLMVESLVEQARAVFVRPPIGRSGGRR